MSRESRLTTTFIELADTLVTGFDVVDLLDTLASRCVEIADVDAAGIVLADLGGRLRVAGSSSEKMQVLEMFEVQQDEGPCLDAYRTGQTIIVGDLARSGRWPLVSAEALEMGFRSVVAIPLRLRSEPIGALNLFRTALGDLSGADVSVCRAFADMATIGLLQERALREARVLAEQLQSALDSRVVLEQAKGMLAERAGVDVAAAFGLIRAYARSNNRLLRDVARDIIDGTLRPDQL